MKVEKNEESAFVSAFKKTLSSQKIVSYAQVETQVLMKKKTTSTNPESSTIS